MGEKRWTKLYYGPWYRKGPFFEASLRAGAQAHGLYNHMYIPDSYGADPDDEYRHLLEHVTLWDVAVEKIIEITGPDAHRFTNMLTCRDLEKCAVRQGRYVLITAADGGIVNDPVLLCLDENRYWLALADSDVGLWARGVAVNAGMNVTIGEPDVYPVQVQGPRSKEVMRDLFGEDVAGLRYYWCAEASVDGIPVLVSRTGWTGEVGFEVYLIGYDRGDDLWNLILEAGKPHEIRVIAPAEARRFEAGIFNYQSDMTIENNPLEITGLERLVEEQEADYVGKAALERIQHEGVKRKLAGIEFLGGRMPAKPTDWWPVYLDGRPVGHVTDAVWSPRLEKNIGYVWVPIELAAPGTELEVRGEYGTMTGRTAGLPFLDPTKEIPKS